MPHAVLVAICSPMTSLLALYFYTNSKRAVHGIIQPNQEAWGTSCGEARAISSSLFGIMILAVKFEMCRFDLWQLMTPNKIGKIC